jgi:predicted nucleic acid-binding protein
MAYITKNQLVSDIELQLNQGNISDDSELDRTQIAQWIDYELYQLVRQECDAVLKQGKQIPPLYINREVANVLTEEQLVIEVADFASLPVSGLIGKIYFVKNTNKYYKWTSTGWLQITQYEVETAQINQRMYFTLIGNVVDLYNDAGIIRVLSDEYDVVNKSSVDSLDMVKHLRFSGPTPEQLVWYRTGKQIYIEGLNTSEISDNSFIVDYVEKQNVLSLGDNDEIRVSDILLPTLIDRVVQRGKLQMYGTVPDVSNDGADVKQQMYHTAISNPTRGQQQQAEQQ